MIHHLISLMLLLPFLGAILQPFLPDRHIKQEYGPTLIRPVGRWVALAASLVSSLIGVLLVMAMQAQVPGIPAAEAMPWIGSYAIRYDMGLDGLNAPLVLLVSILFPILIACEWNRRNGVRGIHGLFLVLQSSFIGVVCAQDIFLQFFFWSLSVIPLYFLIGIWGGKGRESAAFRSLVSSAISGALLFGALLLIYYSVDPHSFSLAELAGGKLAGKSFIFLGAEFSVPIVAFALISAGLAMRAPVWPFHGWFTHLSQEAPLSVVVAVSAVSLPVATYLFERLAYTLFPETLERFSSAIVVVGSINLLMGSACAVAQRDLRSLLAFICLGQVGMVLLGIASLSSAGFVGAIYQQLVLGLGVAGFGLFANLLSERSGSSRFLLDNGERALGGIATQAPAVAVVAGVVVASLLGFPGMGGFVGHSLVVIGSFSAHPLAVLVAGASILLAAYYLFTMYRYVFLGAPAAIPVPAPAPAHAGMPAYPGSARAGQKEGFAGGFGDLTLRERFYMIPLVASLLLFGLYPRPLIELVRPTVASLLSTIK